MKFLEGALIILSMVLVAWLFMGIISFTSIALSTLVFALAGMVVVGFALTGACIEHLMDRIKELENNQVRY